MTSDVFVRLCLAIVTLFGTLVSIYVIPFLHAKFGEVQMSKLLNYVDIAVRCADQIYTKEEWKQKKEYVRNYIISVVNNTLHIQLSDDDINTIIEGFVNEIHNNGVKE